jgi:hypothetical protein
MPTHVENLRKLDELYYSAPTLEYEKFLKEVVEGLKVTLPDFTVAYAEIWTIGPERHHEGRMAHVFVPRKDVKS